LIEADWLQFGASYEIAFVLFFLNPVSFFTNDILTPRARTFAFGLVGYEQFFFWLTIGVIKNQNLYDGRSKW
jgi:hypothetical protein